MLGGLFHIVFNTIQYGPLIDDHSLKVLKYVGKLSYRLGDFSNLAISLFQFGTGVLLLLRGELTTGLKRQAT